MSISNESEFSHSISSVLDYGFDWSLWLNTGETISTSSWTVSDTTLSLGTSQIALGVCSVLIGGGITGKVYKVTNRIQTSIGRADSRTLTIVCTQR